MEKFLQSHACACIISLSISLWMLSIAYRQKGMIYGAFLWLLKWRGRRFNVSAEQWAKICPWGFVFLATIFMGMAIYEGFQKDKPPPTQQELEAARRRFDEAMKRRRGGREEPANPAENPGDPAESN